MKDVIVIGGGLAGLIASRQLAKAGLSVLLLEKHTYPFHKVCGEYISNEVTSFLESIDAYPHAFKPAQITNFRLSSVGGAEASLPLSLGGFGISRYCFDEFLSKKTLEAGAELRQGAHVLEVSRTDNGFSVVLKGGEVLRSRLLLGAWGKRSRLDKQLSRPFMEQRSDFIGVKYHIRGNLPHNEVALHNFPGGYCGVSKIEDNKWNLCYLGSRSRLRHWGSIEAMEAGDLQQNPHLKKIFKEAEFLYQKPLVINEISFRSKQAVEEGILMAGDASGLITPLCGNGMAMAIHAGKILSELIIAYYDPAASGPQEKLEQAYKNAWQNQFARRLWMGRQFQLLFGHPLVSVAALQLMRLKPVGRLLVRQTHGKAF